MQFIKTRGSRATPSTVASGDQVGAEQYLAFGGTNSRTIGQIAVYVDTYTSDSNISSYMTFGVSPSGSAAVSEYMRLTAAGYLGLNNTTPQAMLHVGAGADAPSTGNTLLYVSAAGTTNLAVRDSTNNVEIMMYAYSGGGLIGTQSAHSLNLRTTNNDRVFISAAGLVGIGAAATTYKMEVSTSDASIYGVRVGLGAGADAQSVVVGGGALNANSTGGKNTAIGYSALPISTSSNYTTAVGANALLLLNSADNNTAIGYNAGASITTGASNTVIGYNAAQATLTTGASNIIIGASATTAAASTSNSLVIGSSTNYVATNGGATTYYATTGASLGYIQIRLNGSNVKIQVYTP